MRNIFLIIFTLLFSLSTVSFAADDKANAFALHTTAFLDKGILPVLYTCDGKNESPELDWSNAPAKTQTFVLLFKDPDAPGGTFYHWIVYNIPKSVTKFDQGIKQYPANVLVGKNSFSKSSYNGPCPPKGSTHSYVFTLYALDFKLNLKADAEGQAVLDAMKGHIVGQTELTAVYSRWIK